MDTTDKTQKTLADLWEKHKHKAVTDDEGTYVNLENFSIADHGLSEQDMRTPGNQSFSSTKHKEEGYFLSGDGIGGKFRLHRNH